MNAVPETIQNEMMYTGLLVNGQVMTDTGKPFQAASNLCPSSVMAGQRMVCGSLFSPVFKMLCAEQGSLEEKT
ncbi:hypothetical protein TNCV_1191781 [Trichonephila clavipes]|nr:hypothetical protein TNCV_1191781 [Trichonephila clavipes]